MLDSSVRCGIIKDIWGETSFKEYIRLTGTAN